MIDKINDSMTKYLCFSWKAVAWREICHYFVEYKLAINQSTSFELINDENWS